MYQPIIYTIVSVIVVSLISVFAILPIFFKKKTSHRFLLFLLSLSVGALLGSVFIHFFPEIISQGYHLETAVYVLSGFLLFFVLEKLIHWRHNQKCIHDPRHCGHGHAYHLAPLNLIGDGIHNFIDGLVIAGSYLVSIPLGIAATVSIIFHEIPQEIADFGVLLYSGLTKAKAIFFNFLSALTAILGAIVGLILAGKSSNFSYFIIPFAAGSFIYIAASNLVPELHRHCKLKDNFIHFFAILIGIAIMILITFINPGNLH